MKFHGDFQVIKRRSNVMEERQVGGVISTIINTILDPSPTTTTTPPPAATTTSSTAPPPATTTANPPPAAGTVSTAPAAPPGTTTNAAPPPAQNGGTTATAASPAPAPAPAPVAGGGGVITSNGVVIPAPATSAAAATPAIIPASVISALPASSLTTQLVTAANGTVATTVLPIGAIPSINPFGSIVALNASSSGRNVPVVTVLPGSTGPGSMESDNSNRGNHTVQIAVPIAVILGVLLIGLLIALIMRRQRRNMEDQVNGPSMRYNRANLIAATTGALGFGAAGAFLRNRRGSDYQHSSNGHGNEASLYGPNRGDESGSAYENYQETSKAIPGAALAGGAGLAAAGAAAGRRASQTSGEGEFNTPDEQDGDHGSFFEHNALPDVANVSSSLGHFDAADTDAEQGQTLSPFNEEQGANRESVVSNSQAYDNGEPLENPFDLTDDGQSRPNPNYDGNKIMQNPHLNSSRWSG